jgi:hypothetical protein
MDSFNMLLTIGNFGMKYENYESGWNDTLCKAGTIHLMVSPFVTQVKAGKFLILKAQTC